MFLQRLRYRFKSEQAARLVDSQTTHQTLLSDIAEVKRQLVYRRDYRTLDEARSDVFDYIERLHNPRMRQRLARQDMRL